MESHVSLNGRTILPYKPDLRVNILQPLERKIDELVLEIARLEDRVKSLEKKITNYYINKTLNNDLKK